ncbi:TonB-dependent receptor [Trinickia mobilis]|uniref:TonB-dependent receptor n=1 Tax=Trinickia mobilis TaxID=2816356 RepID=UPI001A8E35E2|nr:TonB-dependent siderophore receptor [Trinickia mobilis]
MPLYRNSLNSHARRPCGPLAYAVGLALPVAAHAQAQPVESSPSLAPVVVSASKREQSARDLDASVATVSAQALDDAEIRGTGDLARVLPGVQMSQSGSELFPIVSARGVTSAQNFYNPALTVYIDGVPQLPVFAYQMLTDVERVELLRGPQGTLYGKSAEGGVIDIVTPKPDAQAVASVEAGAASRHGYVTKGNVSGTLLPGLLYGSLTAVSQAQPGDLSNPATGSGNLGSTRGEAGAARLRLAPEGQPWEVDLALSGEYSRASQDVYLPFYNVDAKTLSSPGPGTPDPYLRRYGNSESLGGSYRAGDWLMTAVAAWQNVHYARAFPFGAYVSEQPERWRQNTQEIRLATQGKGRPWDAVFGLYRQDVQQHRLSTTYPFAPVAVPSPVTVSGSDSQTLAAYADGTWHVTSSFDLGAGVRLSRDSAKTSIQNDSLGATQFEATGRTHRTHALGQVSAGFRLTPDWRVYARIAQGYEPVGFNLTPSSPADATPYGAQTSVNYELGTRYDDQRVSVAAALFHTDTRNMQLFVGPVGGQSIANAGSAYANGAEVALDWRLLPGWSAGVDATAVSAQFSRFDAAPALSYAGKRLPYIPRYSAGAHLHGRIGTAYGALRPGIDIRIAGPQALDVANTLRQPFYATADLRLGWQPNSQVELTVYALNVTNRLYRTYAFTSASGEAFAQINAGRTVGVNVRLDIL